jgi:CHAT domain-containing protein
VAHSSTGDDVSGLAQGFLVAGASSVLAGKTYVVQSAGVAITRGFYEAWLGKRSGKRATKIAALRASQLAAIGTKGWFSKGVWHPHQWGAFQLYGSWH